MRLKFSTEFVYKHGVKMINFTSNLTKSLIGISVFAASLSSTFVFAQANNDQLKSELLLGLMQPLPITIIGPLMASNLEVESTDGLSNVTLERTMLMGALPLGDVTFDLKDLGDKRYEISNFSLPTEVPLPGDMVLKFGSSSLNGVWSFDTRSYEEMRMTLNDISVSAGGGSFELGSLDSLSIEIDQQGKSSIDASRIALGVAGLKAEVPGQSKWNVGKVDVEVATKTGEALDIQALITQGVQAGLMSNDMESLMATLTFLRNRQYEKLDIRVSGEDVDVNIRDGRTVIQAGNASVSLAGGSVSEQRIGDLRFLVDGENLNFVAEDDAEFSANNFKQEVLIEELPLAAVLKAASQVQLAMNGASVDAKISDLYDAFLGFNLLSFTTEASGLKTIIRDRDDETNISFDQASYHTEFQGFRDLDGTISIRTNLDNLAFDLPKLKTTRRRYDYDKGEYVVVELSKEEIADNLTERNLIERTIKLLAPKSFEMDGSITNFGDDLIRKILANMPVDENLPTNLIAVAAVLPTLELETKSNLSYQTQIATLKTSSDMTYVPVRILSFNPYTGTQNLSISNWDEFVAEGMSIISDIENNSDAVKVMTPVVAVLNGFGEKQNGTISWNIVFDGEKDYIMLNGRRVYLGAVLGMASGPMMYMLPMMSMGRRF